MKKGFTLIEVLIVTAMTVLLTTALITNFSRTRTELPRLTAGLINDVRLAQNRAVSGALHGGAHRCGYGVHFEQDHYVVFAGPEPDPSAGCAGDSRTFADGSTVLTVALSPGLQFDTTGDVYFEPPLPTTYVDGVAGNSLTLRLQEPRADCPSAGCRVIFINATGQIQSQ